jgi:hypothetical protein
MSLRVKQQQCRLQQAAHELRVEKAWLRDTQKYKALAEWHMTELTEVHEETFD